MEGKKKIMEELEISAAKRCCIVYCGCCGNKDALSHKYIGERWPVFEEAPDPSLIIWSNLGVTQCGRLVRSILVFLLSVLVVVGSFGLIVWVMKWRDKYKASQWNSDSCDSNDIMQKDAEEAWKLYMKDPKTNKGKAGLNLMQCFCYQ